MISNQLSVKIQDLLSLFDTIYLPIYLYRYDKGKIFLIYRNNFTNDFHASDPILESHRELNTKQLHITNKEIINDLYRCANQKTQFSREYDFTMNNKTMYPEAIIDFCYLHPDIIILIIQKSISFKYSNPSIAMKENLNLKKRIRFYRNSYNRMKIFKDLFTHDINNIINNIKMAVQLVNFYLNNKKKIDDIKNICLSISEQITRGEKLIKNVIVQTQLKEYKKKQKKINLYNYLINAINYIYKSFINRDINIALSPESGDLFIKANELIQDVFENILLNAVKFNDKNTVEIHILTEKIKKKNRLFIEIQFIDNGIGIPERLKGKIFSGRHKSNQEQMGLGIGLNLVQKILELFDATIRVENRIKEDYQKGSKFILTIPSYE
ncbi:MAG: hypothetical protein GF317_01485 [Candidatus Lokiarchaeota archaeon]|nr:hypothetical protein [Candidatus Lokiarchaeota archaeon]MBD3198616.1 hypothetical protein [Candidatus Lokiarchaeota archaeon]